MATESVQVSDVIPAAAERIYRAWLDGIEHAAMTGGAATAEPHVGGRFSAWDGYIRGTNLALEPGRRIVQAWRSADFPEGSPDSRLEILLEADPAGTRVTLIHSEIPEGQAADYEQGWRDHYFQPMRQYFTRAGTPVAAPEPAPLPPPPMTMVPPVAPTRPPAIAMPPAEEWEEIETTVMKSPPVEMIIPSTKAVKPAPVKRPAQPAPKAPPPAAAKPVAAKPVAKKPAQKAAAKPAAKKPANKPATKKAAARPAAKKPVKKAAAKKAATKKPAQKKPIKKIAAKKSPAKKSPNKKAATKKPSPKKKGKR
ncbi:MAG TPA: SRPBCC domain-containing protein [Polyangia bacterium]